MDHSVVLLGELLGFLQIWESDWAQDLAMNCADVDGLIRILEDCNMATVISTLNIMGMLWSCR